MMRAKLLAVLLVLVAIMLIASPAHAAGVVNVCDEPHFRRESSERRWRHKQRRHDDFYQYHLGR